MIPLVISGLIIFDFSGQADREGRRIVNDGVMGGLSRSEMTFTTDSTAVFIGVVSLANDGGFASVRSGRSDFDLGGYAGIEVRAYGDGRSYQLRLRTGAGYGGVAYKFDFDTDKDRWVTIRAPFSEFEATFRGRRMKDHPPLVPADIKHIGFLIADGRAGPFRLELDSVSAFSAGDGD